MNRAYAIVDDFLSPQEHVNLWDAFQENVASPAELREWNRTYQLTDGADPVNSNFRSRALSLRDATPSTSPGPPALRAFSENLLAAATGEQASISLGPWTDFTVSPWVYRAGAGLEWHADTGRLAAFIYYMHPAWRSSWGGELLVALNDSPSTLASAAAAPDDSRSAAEEVCRTGGVFIYPRPNRLVLLRGGILHCIKKVEPAAGKAFRASVSGFFFSTHDTEPLD